MSRLGCSCGHVISDVHAPNEVTGTLLSDKEHAFFDFIDAATSDLLRHLESNDLAAWRAEHFNDTYPTNTYPSEMLADVIHSHPLSFRGLHAAPHGMRCMWEAYSIQRAPGLNRYRGYGPDRDDSGRASEAEVRELRAGAPGLIPESYIEFLATRGAVQVEVAELESMFVMLWPLRDVLQLNRDYRVADLAPGLFAGGSDGGGELLVFDLRNPPDVPVGQLPAIPLELGEYQRLAGSFDELAGWLSK